MAFFIFIHFLFGLLIGFLALTFPYAVPTLALWYGEWQQSKKELPGSIKTWSKIKAMFKHTTFTKLNQWAVGVPAGILLYIGGI